MPSIRPLTYKICRNYEGRYLGTDHSIANQYRPQHFPGSLYFIGHARLPCRAFHNILVCILPLDCNDIDVFRAQTKRYVGRLSTQGCLQHRKLRRVPQIGTPGYLNGRHRMVSHDCPQLGYPTYCE